MNNDIENHMVQPYAGDEPFPSRDEPEFDKYDLNHALADIGRGLPKTQFKVISLEDQIRELLVLITATDNIPCHETMTILRDCLDKFESDRTLVSKLADEVEAARVAIEGCMIGRVQA